MKKSFYRIVFPILLLGVSIVLNGCSNAFPTGLDFTENSNPVETSEVDYTIGEEKAIEIARNLLGLSEHIQYEIYEIESVTSNPNKKESKAIAYVVNFGQGVGGAIVAKDSRVSYQTAKHFHTKDAFNRNQMTAPFIRTLEGYIESQLKSSTRSDLCSPENCNGHKHLILHSNITLRVSEKSPFNKCVLDSHPGCNAGSVAASCAAALSYSMAALSLDGYYYDFSSINYCLEQGEGFNPVVPGLFSMNDQLINFMHSYDGAVDAMAHLMTVLGQKMNTNYQTDNSLANLQDAHNVLRNLGADVSAYQSEFSVPELINLLMNHYL